MPHEDDAVPDTAADEGPPAERDEGPDSRADEATDEPRVAADDSRAHLRDVDVGAGCTEIWEYLAERRRER